MAFVKFLIGFVCLVSFREVTSIPFANSSLEASWPSNLSTVFPYTTFSPVNIETCQARVYPTTVPLTVTLRAEDKKLVLNSGFNVVVYLNQPTTVSRLTGGVLGKDIFIYSRTYYYWNNEASGTAAGLIDGKESPIQTVSVFYNQKYGSFYKAALYRDGFAIIIANVNVEGNVPNPLFTPFEKALQKIQAAGSSTTCANSASVSSFFNVLPMVKYYYAYPGSFTLTDNNGQVCSAIIIQFPTSTTPAISYSQFQAFQNLRNYALAPVNAVLSPSPLGCRPLVQAAGTKQVVLP